jgi:tetratricopeptide (TPR) repeat protein
MEAGLAVLFWLGVRRVLRSRRRLRRTRGVWRRRLAWLPAALCLGYVVAVALGLTRPYMHPGTSLVVLLGLGLTWLVLARLLGANRADRLNHQVVAAVQSGKYPEALALVEGRPALVARSTELRYNHALIRAVLGRREEALVDLERLRRDDPAFKLTWLLLVSLYADEGEYAHAQEMAVELSRDLPGEMAGAEVESWLLRKLGRLEEAEARAREVLKREPRSGQARLTLAAVALDRGDLAGARKELADAERVMPGSTSAALLAAEIALATGEGAEDAVRRAVDAVKNNPLALSDKEAVRLAQRLEARRQESPG